MDGTESRRSRMILFSMLITSGSLLVGSVSAFVPSIGHVASVEENLRIRRQSPTFVQRLHPTVPPLRLDLFPFRRKNGSEDIIGSSTSSSSSVHHHTQPPPMTDSLRLHVDDDSETGQQDTEDPEGGEEDLTKQRLQLRKRVNQLAKQMISPMPRAIAYVLRDATMDAVDMAVDEVLGRKSTISSTSNNNKSPTNEKSNNTGTSSLSSSASLPSSSKDVILSGITLDLVNEAFEPMERSLKEMETSLDHARAALSLAKSQASEAIQAIQAAALAQAEGAANVVQHAEEEAQLKVMNEIYAADIGTLRLEDIDFTASEMAPPFLDESSCLVPGEPVVRVEKAPENSRRIFAGIDIRANVEDVWNVSLFCCVPERVVDKRRLTRFGIGNHGVLGCPYLTPLRDSPHRY
jgi:hypothetical protein